MNSKIELEQVADLAMVMYEESPFKLSVDRSDFIKTLTSGVHTITYSLDDRVVGFIIGGVGSGHPIWGDVKYAYELAWYVHPDYRSKGIAIKLLELFEEWAVTNEVEFIVCAAMHNNSFDQVKSMYEKRGYSQTEVAFIKELK